jgi:hypothetical protein
MSSIFFIFFSLFFRPLNPDNRPLHPDNCPPNPIFPFFRFNFHNLPTLRPLSPHFNIRYSLFDAESSPMANSIFAPQFPPSFLRNRRSGFRRSRNPVFQRLGGSLKHGLGMAPPRYEFAFAIYAIRHTNCHCEERSDVAISKNTRQSLSPSFRAHLS